MSIHQGDRGSRYSDDAPYQTFRQGVNFLTCSQRAVFMREVSFGPERGTIDDMLNDIKMLKKENEELKKQIEVLWYAPPREGGEEGVGLGGEGGEEGEEGEGLGDVRGGPGYQECHENWNKNIDMQRE